MIGWGSKADFRPWITVVAKSKARWESEDCRSLENEPAGHLRMRLSACVSDGDTPFPGPWGPLEVLRGYARCKVVRMTVH